MCTSGEAWRLPRSPSHDSVATNLSLFSVSSAASDAKLLRILAGRAGQGPDPSTLRGTSPNPDSKHKGLKSLSLRTSGGGEDGCRELLAGCAALCAALGLHRSFSSGDVMGAEREHPTRGWSSELGLGAALEARALGAASRSCSTWVAVGGSRLPSPQRAVPPTTIAPADLLPELNKKVRQNYIRRRLLTTCRALERLSQSEFNLDKLEAVAVVAAAAAAGPGPTTLSVPPPPRAGSAPPRPPDEPAETAHDKPSHQTALFPSAMHLALTAADLERERGRPLSKYERNMMIFNWLHTLDDAAQL